MNAKQYLKQAYRLYARIEDKLERLEDLRMRTTGLHSMTYGQTHGNGKTSPDASYTYLLMNLIEVEQELQREIETWRALYIEISRAIDRVEDANCSLVLSKRYLMMKTWDQIAKEMNYSTMQIHRIHKKGLEMFTVPEKML